MTKKCKFCGTAHCGGVMYNNKYIKDRAIAKGLSEEKANVFLEQFLEKECKRLPDVRQTINDIFSK